jgi:ribonuclease R
MNNLTDRILKLLKSETYRPLKQHEIAKALNIKPGKRNQFRRELKSLEAGGVIQRQRGNRLIPASGTDEGQRIGELRVASKGHGYITVAGEEPQDYFVDPENRGHALHGDRVAFVEIPVRRRGRPRRDQLPEARITEVIERGMTEVVGLLMKLPAYAYVLPDDTKVPENVTVREYAEGLDQVPAYHKVVVKLDPYSKEQTQLTGTLIEDLGDEKEPGVDIASIARRKGFKASHETATSQAAALIQPLQNMDPRERHDLREQLIFTIDPSDAKDFDDAVSLEPLKDGGWRLGVHIADVSHYVTPGTPVDEEAYLRGNSVYLVDRVLPMLPAHLTTNVCSLVPSEDRLTHTADIVLDADLNIRSAQTYPSIIHSKARLDYGQVQQFLMHDKTENIQPPVQRALRDMHQVASRLRQRRMENGSVDLSLPEVKCLLDNQGHTRRIIKRTEHESYHLIEEFMLLANQVVAGIILDSGSPGIYRVHPDPDQDQWKRMTAELNELGVPGKVLNRRDINRVARETRNQPIEYAAGLAILRNFKQAVYTNTCSQHFGLAFERYTHFTSPIRRYPDLIVHRVLKAVERKETAPFTADQLADIARHCSDTERAAMEAERESLDLKRIEYYMEQYRKGNNGPYKAIISAVLPIGLIAELLDSQQRGLIHFSSLGHDRYVVNSSKTRATGRRDGRHFAIGMQVEVQIIRVDERQNQVDFKLLSGGNQKAASKDETSGPSTRGRRTGRTRGLTEKKNRGRKKKRKH